VLTFKGKKSRAWWYTLVSSALRRLEQNDQNFKARLGYRGSSSLKKTILFFLKKRKTV
jgi:hypothetical protein